MLWFLEARRRGTAQAHIHYEFIVGNIYCLQCIAAFFFFNRPTAIAVVWFVMVRDGSWHFLHKVATWIIFSHDSHCVFSFLSPSPFSFSLSLNQRAVVMARTNSLLRVVEALSIFQTSALHKMHCYRPYIALSYISSESPFANKIRNIEIALSVTFFKKTSLWWWHRCFSASNLRKLQV